jgi:hypothetical protein
MIENIEHKGSYYQIPQAGEMRMVRRNNGECA